MLKHKFVSPKADGPDTTELRPSNWNDEHAFSGGAIGNVLVRDTGAADGASWQTKSAVDVRDYGVVGNGTADDTTTIQAALTAGGSNSDVVFPAGTYRLNAGLTISGFGQRLRFLPGASLRYYGSGVALTTSAYNVHLYNPIITNTGNSGTVGVDVTAISGNAPYGFRCIGGTMTGFNTAQIRGASLFASLIDGTRFVMINGASTYSSYGYRETSSGAVSMEIANCYFQQLGPAKTAIESPGQLNVHNCGVEFNEADNSSVGVRGGLITVVMGCDFEGLSSQKRGIGVFLGDSGFGWKSFNLIGNNYPNVDKGVKVGDPANSSLGYYGFISGGDWSCQTTDIHITYASSYPSLVYLLDSRAAATDANARLVRLGYQMSNEGGASVSSVGKLAINTDGSTQVSNPSFTTNPTILKAVGPTATTAMYGGGSNLGAGAIGTTTNHALLVLVNGGEAARFDTGLNFLPASSGKQLGDSTHQWRVYTQVVATGSLPAAASAMDGVMLLEDVGAGDRNLIIYAGGQRFRIDGGTAF